jgi:2-oxo-hept-3-ene-1,7-dioate hydratase
MLNKQIHKHAAQALLDAEKNLKPIVQLSKTYPAMEIADAYRIQDIFAAAKAKMGSTVVGHKIGLTSRAMQQASKMTEPDYGRIFSDAVFHDGARIAASRFIKPRLEVELAFIMGADLSGSNIHVHDVLRATEQVLPALEIIDYRTEVPRAITDTISDNAAFAAIVLGGRPVRPFDVDLRWIGAALSKNGVIEETGLSAGVMGHPAAGIAWLVNKLHGVNSGLRKGQLVLAGSFTRPVDIASGDVVHVDYGALGGIGVSFS